MFKIPRRKLLGMTTAVFGFFTTLSIIITELRLVQPPDPGPRQSFAMIPSRVFSGLGQPPVCVLNRGSLVADAPRDDTFSE